MIETKQELQKQLSILENKWKDFEPLSDVDKSWWRYKCDCTLMKRLRSQIKYYTKYVKEQKELEKIEADKLKDISNFAESLFK